MSRRAPIKLPPLRADLAVARFCAHRAFPKEERMLKTLTVLADEKTVVAGALLYWLVSRLGNKGSKTEGNRMLCSVAIGCALPHVLKHLFSRERPDRTVARNHHRRGIPRSGDAWDSFPSGHAINLGAVAAPLARSLPSTFRPTVWPALSLLAASRVLLLAHYPSDVAAGLGIGVLVERVTSTFLDRRSHRATRRSGRSARNKPLG
jgi:undecaprenyl-diphosphatase